MDKDKRFLYANTLLKAYNDSLIKIIWSTSGFSLGVEPQNRDALPELKEEDFIEYAFSIIKKVINIAEGKQNIDSEDKDIEIAQKIYESEYDLKNHLCIKKNNTIDSYKLIEYEIISHRNSSTPSNIEASSAIIKITVEKGEEENNHIFEVSRRDIKDIISLFSELKDKIDTI